MKSDVVHVVICSRYVTLIGEDQNRDWHVALVASRIFANQPKLEAIEQVLAITTGDFLMT